MTSNRVCRISLLALAMNLFIFFVQSASAWALENTVAHVVRLEGTFMPSYIKFQLDGGTSTCGPYTWLTWQKDADNNKAIYATLLAALSSGKRIELYLNNGDTSCTGQYIHFLE